MQHLSVLFGAIEVWPARYSVLCYGAAMVVSTHNACVL